MNGCIGTGRWQHECHKSIPQTSQQNFMMVALQVDMAYHISSTKDVFRQPWLNALQTSWLSPQYTQRFNQTRWRGRKWRNLWWWNKCVLPEDANECKVREEHYTNKHCQYWSILTVPIPEPYKKCKDWIFVFCFADVLETWDIDLSLLLCWKCLIYILRSTGTRQIQHQTTQGTQKCKVHGCF